jgi:hypothetical protein
MRNVYLSEGVNGQDNYIRMGFSIVDNVQIVELLQFEIGSLHILNNLVEMESTEVKNIETSSPQVMALMIVFIADFFSLMLLLIRELMRF